MIDWVRAGGAIRQQQAEAQKLGLTTEMMDDGRRTPGQRNRQLLLATDAWDECT
jgi:hypothetical protein